MKELQVGVDVGGTFTDVVAVDDNGEIHYAKTPSTPEDSSIGVINGIKKLLQELKMPPESIISLIHGTTIATNALLERNGSFTGLITTKGFRDVLHIGRQNRASLYDITAQRFIPLVPRQYRLEVSERTLCNGEIMKVLDEQEMTAVVRNLLAGGIKSLAICFLNSYANPANEQKALEICKKVAPDLPVSISSEIQSEIREFERTNTTVLNAYVQPVMKHYISRLTRRLVEAGIRSPLMIMKSSGGTITTIQAVERPVHTLLSGPAAAVLAGMFLSRVTGNRNLITADLGGTSFDAAIVRNGKPEVTYEGEITGLPVRIPQININTIGAGGGSICWVDSGGALQVGPRSSGAKPGPICYEKGGADPTVTDAHAVLNRVKFLLGKEQMVLNSEAAKKAIAKRLAGPLGLSVEETAEGVLRIVNESMARAIRVITVQRGIDIRNFTLVTAGGAGAMHGAELARAVGIKYVLVPKSPGNFSAFGLIIAPLRYEEVRTYKVKLRDLDLARVANLFSAMEKIISAQLKENEYLPEMRYLRYADVRYCGQAYEITVPIPEQFQKSESWNEVINLFQEMHEQFYGFKKPNEPIEVVNLRLTAIGDRKEPELKAIKIKKPNKPAAKELRQVYFNGAWVETPIYQRELLIPGDSFEGPAIIEEMSSTTVLPPDDSASVDEWGNIRITLK
jgi:N-methylhydantoinase A